MTKCISYDAEFLIRLYDPGTHTYVLPVTDAVALDICDAYGWRDEIKRLRDELARCHDAMTSMLDEIELSKGEPDFRFRRIFNDLHIPYDRELYKNFGYPTKESGC